MHRLYSLILCLLTAACLSATETSTTLHDSQWVCGDGWTTVGTETNFVQIPVAQLAGLAAGDVISVGVSAISATDQWPCVFLSYADAGWNWQNFDDSAPRQCNLSASTAVPYTAHLALTQEMVDLILAGQTLNVTGSGYTGTAITWTHTEPDRPAGYIDTLQIWSGNEQIGNWNNYILLEKDLFSRAAEGDILSVHVSAIRTSGSCINLQNGNWQNFNPAQQHAFSSSETAPTYADFRLSSAMLAEIMTTGYLILNGTYYTADRVILQIKDEALRLKATSPVYQNWVFGQQDRPAVKISFQSPATEAADATVSVQVKTDKGAAVLTKDTTVSVPAGTSDAIIPLALTEPGIYAVLISVNAGVVEGYNIAVRPEEIVSAPDMQTDFQSFWADTKAALAAVAPQYTLTRIAEKSTSSRDVYLLSFRSLQDKGDTAAVARAYWAVPTDGRRHRTTIHYQGYDSGGYDPWCPSGNDNPTECDLVLATRGQLINNRAPYRNDYGDWFAYGFESRETFYYRGAFADAIRALDFVWEQVGVDTLNVFAEGSSQGGALTYAAAALGNHLLRAIAPAIPFLGDFPDYFQIAQWPASVANTQRQALGMTEAQMYTMLSYFDTKNLATLVSCPVIECIGLQDGTCPPHTNLAPYNNLDPQLDREMRYNAKLQHAVASNWWTVYRAFFDRHAASETALDQTEAAPAAVKRFVDGRVVILLGGQAYDALGRVIE